MDGKKILAEGSTIFEVALAMDTAIGVRKMETALMFFQAASDMGLRVGETI